MHDTAYIAARAFAENYGAPGKVVIDIGGKNVNGSMRKYFEGLGMKFICIDMDKHPSVDIIVQPGSNLPFETGSIDLIISTSCFEHDPCFWLTFKEMTRVVKSDGYIYVNAPSNGTYHCFPGDNWRFYSDAGQALAYWSGIQMGNEEVYPVKVVETFHILPIIDVWTDFICIWKRTAVAEKTITVAPEIVNTVGPLEQSLKKIDVTTIKKFNFRK